ncbi:class B sortase [Lacrimispora indolis]|uniref:class B sortase n=1 Tax=Lacrimispora indolis TaxID=69825 RepID=UPI000A057256|nr:class B sortase [Lacrimispora indolis]
MKIAAGFLLMVSVCVMVFSWYKMRESLQIYAEGDQNYKQLQTQIRHPAGANASESEALALVDIPSIYIDFEMLQKVNTDAAVWLYCPDTEIDYPVMCSDDYNWYLHHLPDGTYHVNGTLFLDYSCPPDFSGRLSIIYGHNMKSGKMFGSLVKYKEQKYFEQYPYLYLYTEQGNYRIDLKYGCVIGADQWRDQAFMFEGNLEALLSHASSKTTFESGTEYTDRDKFIVLSTCSYEFDDARYIVIGVLRPEYGA